MSKDSKVTKIKKRARNSRLGLVEKISLWIRGKRDANQGLPRPAEDGSWTSPTIQKELNACSEAHAVIYQDLQENLFEGYQEAAHLAELLERASVRRTEISRNYPEPLTDKEENMRNYGEEALTDSQVVRRRRREHGRSCMAVQEQIEAVLKEAEENLDKLIGLENLINQSKDEVRILADNIRCHTMQRIEFYWNSACYVAFKKKRTMPVSYAADQVKDICEMYRDIHA